jgi:hypothetical protein
MMEEESGSIPPDILDVEAGQDGKWLTSRREIDVRPNCLLQ